LCYFAARRWGLVGAAWTLVGAEVVVNLYVLPAALRLAGDTLPEFLGSFKSALRGRRPLRGV